jgi:hypothetical protein
LSGAAPNILTSERGVRLRQRVKELLDTKIRIATGAAANAGEEQRFATIVGADTFNTDRDLLNGINQAEKMLSDQEAFLDAGHTEAAGRFRQNLKAGPGPSVPGSPDEIVQVRNAAGQVMPVKRKNLARAEADGFKEVK